jgi:dTDP-4-dehydrorhamnose reductase
MMIVTGSAGYIGSSLCKSFDKRQISYLGIDKRNQKLKNQITCNLCDTKSLFKILKSNNPDCIYHCGTYSAGDYEKNFLSSYESDSLALVNILNFIRQSSREVKLIFFSSSYVYSGIKGSNKVNELSLINPLNSFGIAKFFFERLIIHTNPNSILFRMSNVFGPGNQIHKTVVNQWIKDAKKGNDLIIWGEGERKIQYIFIDDVISFLSEVSESKPGIYNLGGPQYLSMNKMATIFSEKYDNKVINLLEKNEGETLPFMDTNKLKNNFNKRHLTNFDEVI